MQRKKLNFNKRLMLYLKKLTNLSNKLMKSKVLFKVKLINEFKQKTKKHLQ